ncbi:MAG: choice-of-anchor D domain-containing protein [Labilithrix sp.]|nr:choice-of-anchor D domain-containing protein [Labilithrix sp.]MCW5812915.1 choice-of-anchor D domain-containing protein [Labilithrix sp.]
MRRAHWIVMGAWVGLFAAAAAACGDSATGADIPDPPGADGSASDASRTDASVVVPTKDSSVTDTGTNEQETSVPTGDGGLPTVSTAEIDFGNTDCGSTAAAQTFTISNPSAVAVSFTSELVKSAASPFTIDPASGSIPSGQSVTVTVTPKPVAIPSTTAQNGLGDQLKLSIGPTTATLDLKQSARGGVLRFSVPSGIDFGNRTIGTPVENVFAVTNAGNAPVPITLSVADDPSPFALSVNPTTATPGVQEARVTFTPTAEEDYTSAIKLTPGAGPLCDVAPADISLKGTGTTGVVSVTPPSISFGSAAGLVDCGTTAPSQKVRITNSSNAAFQFSALLTRSTTVYTLSYNTTANAAAINNQTVAANSFVELTVVPKQIPQTSSTAPDAFGDTLTITTTAPGDATPHAIELHQTARGAVVTRSTNSITILNAAGAAGVPIGVTATSPSYTFTNLGNVDIVLDQKTSAGTPFSVSASTLTLGSTAGTNSASSSASFTPVAVGATSDIATVSQPADAPPVVLCGNLPGNLTLSGTGAAPSIAAAPSPLNFNFVPCGTQAAARTVRLTNNGPATTFTATLAKGAGSGFTVSPANGPIGAGAAIDVTVTPKLIPSGTTGATTSTANNGINDVLELTTGNVAAPFNVTINETAQGAVIDFNNVATKNFANTARGATSAPSPTTVRNTGNLSADLTFTVTTTSGPAGFTDAFGPATSTSTISAGTTSTSNNNLTFFPTASPVPTGLYQGAYSVTLANPVPICAPLPTMVLTGTATN